MYMLINKEPTPISRYSCYFELKYTQSSCVHLFISLLNSSALPPILILQVIESLRKGNDANISVDLSRKGIV